MIYFATYFDKNYLSRGLTLYSSLKEYAAEFELYILCLDEFTLDFFESNAGKYPEIKTIPIFQLEEADSELKESKTNRSKIEYYFTLSPCLPLYVLENYGLPHICSLDADILFLNNPKPLFDYLNDYSIIITPHKFSNETKDLITWGEYNVSFQVFKNDEDGIHCLKYWRKQCINWCGDYYDQDNNRFADQKYLDRWSELYPGKLKILHDNVSGLAPWNLNNYKITLRNGKFYSNGERIIFYHFHHFKYFGKFWSSNGFNIYFVKSRKIVDKLYLLYWNRLKKVNAQFRNIKDASVRQEHSNNMWLSIFNENFVYYNLLNKQLIYLNLKKLPVIIKRILIKLNGGIN